MLIRVLGCLTSATLIALPLCALPAQVIRPSLQDSFGLGSASGILCRVQSSSTDPALASMFDRGYAIVCRDAAKPVGRMYALRKDGGDPLARLAGQRSPDIACDAAAPGTVADLGAISISQCRMSAAKVDYRVYAVDRGKTVYVAEGPAGYASALELGLRSIVTDRVVPGEIAVATTALADPAAFAALQAGTLDPARARVEGYRRNASGSYAESAEFFDALLRRADDGVEGTRRQLGEYLVNRALQNTQL